MSNRSTKSTAGRKPKPKAEQVQPVSMRLEPVLYARLNRVRASRPWGVVMSELVTLAEGKMEVAQ